MKKIYIILLSIIGVISSCTKHEDIIDTSLQPGSILCSDGSIVHPSLFSPNEKEAIGVVFWCNDGNNPDIKETAYAVSLEDLEENPLIDTDEDIANVSEDENSFDGAANTAAIMNFAIKDSLAYPAAQKAIEYAPKGVTGWFIGSIAQNKAISNNLEIIILAAFVVTFFTACTSTHMITFSNAELSDKEKDMIENNSNYSTASIVGGSAKLVKEERDKAIQEKIEATISIL